MNRLFNVASTMSCLASLNASSHVCSTSSETLTISSGVYLLHPINTNSNMLGLGVEASMYVFRASKLAVHAVMKVAYMSDSNFDLGTCYGNTFGRFNIESQGGMVATVIGGRLSVGKEVAFLREDVKYLDEKSNNCLCTRLYSGIGIALEGNRLHAKDGIVPLKGLYEYAIDEYMAFSIIFGVDLKLFYAMNSLRVSPELFVGPSVFGRGLYGVAKGGGTGSVVINDVRASQEVAVSVVAAVPVSYKIDSRNLMGIRLGFKWNWRGEEFSYLRDVPAIKLTDIPLTDNIEAFASLQFTHINM